MNTIKKNKVRPTLKQLAALEILKANPDMPKGEAMVRAGYSPETSKAPKQKLVDSRGFEVAISNYQEELAGLGLTHKKLAEKTAEWIDAQKIDHSHTEPDKLVPDYPTQLRAAEMLRNDLGLSNKGQEGSGLAIQVNTIINSKKEEYAI